jgi:2-polyprenyl-3-methyl-5-hydroxy-6-metoxy-1,4-benzoquinol methylase
MKHPNATAADDWDRHWHCFAEAASLNPAQQFRHQLIVQKARRAWQGRALPARLLDFGSGQGDLAVELHRAFPEWDLVGFEMSAEGVAISAGKVSSGRFRVVDLFHPSPEAAEFAGWADLAACSEVLEHVDDPVAFLRATLAYLKPGARLFITVPGGPMSAFDRHIGHRRHFDAASLRAVIEAAGLQADQVERSGFPFFNLYRLLVIFSGKRLVGAAQRGEVARGLVPRALAAIFRPLLLRSLRDAPGGWQMVAQARRPD